MAVTAARLIRHNQSLDVLEPRAPAVSIDLTPASAGPVIAHVAPLFSIELIRHFDRIPNDLQTMERRAFEQLVAELFDAFGFDVELTQQTRDHGIDIVAIRAQQAIHSRYLIQCKRPNPGNVVGVSVVRDLYGVKVDQGATKAVAVTTTRFSKDAHQFHERHLWELDLAEFGDLKAWITEYLRLRGPG